MSVRNHVLRADEVVEVCTRYQSGESTTQIAKSYGVSAVAIQGLLKRRGIARRKRKDYHQHTANYRFFETIDTEEKAYWLGFLAADGGVRDNCVTLRLALPERDHVQRFADALQATQPVRKYVYPTRSMAVVGISSDQLCKALAQWGIRPRKTYSMSWPDKLPQYLVRHFIRGYFDGDGCITIHPGKNYKCPELIVTGHERFIAELQTRLMVACSLKQTKLDRRFEGKPWVSMRYVGRLQVNRIANYMYAGATVWLPRKRDKIEPFLAGMVKN